MKIQLAILFIFALMICDVISAESEKTSKLVGKKMGRHKTKIRNLEDAQKGERRSRFPRRLSHEQWNY
ncbi:Protein CBG26426 [Caenorhabditis briggsae]|uniref:Protein CBG26426 n=1 Tax=Caenorhabditis briggsae TaxID=6238 RepID=B6ILF9_CAEBR|nr:Protein CBG26426 [Caenorhabditis briggsae]CAS00739.1 Protein CBG26426 [Caenorhabditis briggsae]